jgi:hypothetical protein
MKSKLFRSITATLAIVGVAMLTSASQSSAITILSLFYDGNSYTTNLDPAHFSPQMRGNVRLAFDSSVLTAADVTGTYTLSGGPNGIITFIGLFSFSYNVASSQTPDTINPLSYIA